MRDKRPFVLVDDLADVKIYTVAKIFRVFLILDALLLSYAQSGRRYFEFSRFWMPLRWFVYIPQWKSFFKIV